MCRTPIEYEIDNVEKAMTIKQTNKQPKKWHKLTNSREKTHTHELNGTSVYALFTWNAMGGKNTQSICV